MSGRIGLVVIHGMGAQQEDFADALMADVLSRVGADGSRVVWTAAGVDDSQPRFVVVKGPDKEGL